MSKIKLLVIFLFVHVIMFGQNNLEFKIKRQTPEPNTKLSLFSKIALKQINKAMLTGNPDSVFSRYNERVSFFRRKEKYYIEKKIGLSNLTTRFFYPRKVKKRQDSALPVVIFFHGGGFIWGKLDMYNIVAHKLARTLNSIIVVPAYRLAPESPFPAAVDDCSEVLDWVAQNIGLLGGNIDEIGLMGESAGGNLAVVTTLRNLQREKPYNIKYQILYYPSTAMTDERFESRNYFFDSCGVWYVLNRPLMIRMKEEYLKGTPADYWEVSPLYADYDESIPPTLVATAQCDPLRDEGQLLAVKMRESGVHVVYTCYPKTIHGFVCMYPFLKQGRQAIRKTKIFIEENR